MWRQRNRAVIAEVLQHGDNCGRIDQPSVAGNSLGGWISLELAKRGLVRSATGLSPAGFFNDREATYSRASLRPASSPPTAASAW